MKITKTLQLCRILPAVALLLAINVKAQDSYSYAAQKSNKSRSTSTGSQDTNDKQTLISVLKDLNKQKGVFFLYSEESMSQKLVNRVKDMQDNVEKILDDVLKNSGLKHKKVSENTFVILNSSEKGRGGTQYIPADFSATNIPDQPVYRNDQVTGRLTDHNGSPLAGVSVTVKGTNKGTSTNIRGEFTIEANKGDILVFSFVGFATQEAVVGDNNTMSISLALSDNNYMNEAVVTALGIRKEAKKVGYAIGKVGGSELTMAREINVGNALVGKVAGVNSSGPLTGAGGSSKVVIRGNSSLNGDNQPLYVVNGIPLNNSNLGSAGMWGGADLGDGISSINPDDIEDMTILKGGAAAALYGQRGKNGVILITTKSGRAKKALGIELNTNFTIDRINDFTEWQTTYGQGTLGAKPASQTAALQTGLQSWGAKLDGANVTLFDGLQHPYSYVSGDNMKEFYKTGTTVTNTLAITNGNENGDFRFSFGDLRNKGVYRNSEYNRNNVNLDLNYKLSEQWSGQANVTYVKEVGKNRSNLSDAPGNGNYGILFLPPNVKGSYLEPGYDATGKEMLYNGDAFTTNPYFAANKFQNDTRKDRILGMANLRFTPVKWLYVQGRITNDFFVFNANQITPTGTAYRPTGSLDNESTNIFNEMNLDLLLGITRNLTSDISMGFTGGANLLKMKQKNTAINANGLAFPYLYNPAAATSRNANLSEPKKEVHSVYASLEFGYKNVLFLNLSDRNDWSSTLPKDNNSYNYPSASVAYIFTEHFKPSWLDYGKIRTGYAMVGGDADPFQTSLYYSTNGSINGNPLGNLGGGIPNTAIEPLKVKEFEIGTDLRFLRNRAFVEFSWYNKQTINDIVQGSVSITSGFQNALVNVGKIENKGIEVMVGGTPVKGRNFTWTTSFNIADNKNKIVRLAEGQTFLNLGQSRTQRGFIHHRLDMPFAQVMTFDIKRDAKGDMVLNASGLPQSSDALVARGTAIHPVTGGFSNTVSYKNLTLDFLVDFKYGAVIYSGTNARGYGNGLHQETIPGRETGVTVKGVNASGTPMTVTVPAQTYYGALAAISGLHTYDADFIKFRSFSLAYTVPAKVFNNKIAGLSIALVGRNLFYISRNTPNIDPEANYNNSNAQGLEYASLPSVKSYGINLNIKF